LTRSDIVLKQNAKPPSVNKESVIILSDMESRSVRIEIYYTAGCPNRRITVERVREVLRELAIAGKVREVMVHPPLASVRGFLGTPTVHVNGIDIERSARTSHWAGVMCRTYRDREQIDSAPSKQLIRQAILDAGNPLWKTAKA
jgi:hypothetical protein